MIRPALALMLSAAPLAAHGVDDTPRIAVMSAFEPEWISLQAGLEGAETQTINGTEFITGTLSGQEVVLFLSGVSMVNAAMTTQMALERFDVEAIVFSGIAGGVDPALNIGDVVVADQWGQWLETVMARRTEDGFALPGFLESPFPNYDMIYTRETTVASDRGEPETRFWFPADPALLEPMMAVEVTTPEEYMGDVIGDLNSRRGQVRSMEDASGVKIIKAIVPLTEMFGYIGDLRGKTQGRAVFSMAFDSYGEVPKNVADEIIQKSRGE